MHIEPRTDTHSWTLTLIHARTDTYTNIAAHSVQTHVYVKTRAGAYTDTRAHTLTNTQTGTHAQ